MPSGSSDSVKIIYYNRELVAQAVREALKKLTQEHPELQEAILFGSFVRGDAVPGSDVDMLLILSDSTLTFLERIPKYIPTTVPGGVDIFPYTRQELDRMLAEGNPFIHRALSEGQRLTRQEILKE